MCYILVDDNDDELMGRRRRWMNLEKRGKGGGRRREMRRGVGRTDGSYKSTMDVSSCCEISSCSSSGVLLPRTNFHIRDATILGQKT